MEIIIEKHHRNISYGGSSVDTITEGHVLKLDSTKQTRQKTVVFGMVETSSTLVRMVVSLQDVYQMVRIMTNQGLEWGTPIFLVKPKKGVLLHGTTPIRDS